MCVCVCPCMCVGVCVWAHDCRAGDHPATEFCAAAHRPSQPLLVSSGTADSCFHSRTRRLCLHEAPKLQPEEHLLTQLITLFCSLQPRSSWQEMEGEIIANESPPSYWSMVKLPTASPGFQRRNKSAIMQCVCVFSRDLNTNVWCVQRGDPSQRSITEIYNRDPSQRSITESVWVYFI